MGGDEVVFDYSLLGAGWSDTHFAIGDSVLDVRLGDSPDPLEDLMIAALGIARGDDSYEVVWDPEDGGYYRWRFRARPSSRMEVRIDYVSDSGSPGAKRDGPVRLQAECSRLDLCTTIAETAQSVLSEHGPSRFAELNFSPFPFDLLDDLQAAVAVLRG